MLRLHPISRAKTPRRSPWDGLAALREGMPAPHSFPRQSERRLHERRRRHDGSQRRKNEAAREGGLKVALRELAISLKKWAQNEKMMGMSYPSQPGFDPDLIRAMFGHAGIPYVTRVLQDRQISYIGINDISNEIIVFTKKKLNSRDARALSAAATMIGGQQIALIFKHGGIGHAGGPPGPPILAPIHMHNNRFACGGSVYIGSEKGAGTLGCLVRSSDGTLYGLSNNHITGGCNYAVPGLPIIAPGLLDVAAGGQDPETIGHHYKAYPYVDGIPEIVDADENLDAAIFTIGDADRISSMQRGAYDTPAECIPMQVGMRVSKVGRTTGTTQGEIVAEMPDCEPIEYSVDIVNGKKFIWFKSLFAIQATPGFFSQPGDSGSLIANLDQNNVRRTVGIIVGGDETGLCFALSMHRVLEHFDVELVSNHNV